MALDTQVRSFLEKLATTPGGPPPLTVAERRASLERLLRLGGQPEPVARIEKRRIRGPGGLLRIWVYTPAGAPSGLLPGLVYFHGGGFVAGSLETYDGICRSLANTSGYRLVAVDYRLGPEAPFPAAVQDACAATRWAADHSAKLGIDARLICVAGDAAGGTLAAVVAQTLAAEEGPPLALQYLLPSLLRAQGRDSLRGDGVSPHGRGHPCADPIRRCVTRGTS